MGFWRRLRGADSGCDLGGKQAPANAIHFPAKSQPFATWMGSEFGGKCNLHSSPPVPPTTTTTLNSHLSLADHDNLPVVVVVVVVVVS